MVLLGQSVSEASCILQEMLSKLKSLVLEGKKPKGIAPPRADAWGPTLTVW